VRGRHRHGMISIMTYNCFEQHFYSTMGWASCGGVSRYGAETKQSINRKLPAIQLGRFPACISHLQLAGGANSKAGASGALRGEISIKSGASGTPKCTFRASVLYSYAMAVPVRPRCACKALQNALSIFLRPGLLRFLPAQGCIDYFWKQRSCRCCLGYIIRKEEWSLVFYF
jgi:hypothetical protein